MIKRFLILFTVCFVLTSAHPASATTTFLREHINECEGLFRNFYANGDDGFVLINYEPGVEPVKKVVRDSSIIKNREFCFIRYTYNHNGELWGFLIHYRYNHNFASISGWVPMNQLLPMYGSTTFFEEHENEFYPYTGDYKVLKAAERVILWPWPGSGKINKGLFWRARTIEAKEVENVGISYAYKDNDGREWGYVIFNTFVKSNKVRLDIQSENYNYTNGWICVSDPANEDIPAFNPRLSPWPEEVFIPPHIITSGDNTFIEDITEDNRNVWIQFSKSLLFRPFHYREGLIGIPMNSSFYEGSPPPFLIKNDNNYAEKVQGLWKRLYEELSDAAKPERFKILYAFAFNLTKEEHALCEAQPDEILYIIQGKESILTWLTPEIQWGDELRIRYLRDYIKILKENGYADWAEAIENREGKDYLYDDLNRPE